MLQSYCAANPRLRVSVVSESVPHLKKGVIRDFKNIMLDVGQWEGKRWNITSAMYTFENGSYIEFFSASDASKLRGSRRDILFINEANNITFEAFTQLQIRTSAQIYLDFNPSNEFWAHTELLNDPDAEWQRLTYLDNEAAPKAAVREIEKARQKAKISAYWDNWYKVYGLGELGILEGVIFSNWEVIEKIPEEARITGYGMDYGYTNDPTTLINRYEYNGIPIWDEVIYDTGLQNTDIVRLMTKNNVHPTIKGYGDSADPKTISYLSLKGYNINPVTKGKDSILFGIDALQAHEKMYVTASSLNVIKELRSYAWDRDKKTGKKLNSPIDGYNHAIDAMRYVEFMLALNKSPIKSATQPNYRPRHKIKRL